MMNLIEKNIENGILTEARKKRNCDALITFNTIERNKENGILCTGKGNLTRIEKNLSISHNTKAGIRAADEATLAINLNLISNNFGQGILLVETTYAHIEKNLIKQNYKANIAFGGKEGSDTVIINNEI